MGKKGREEGGREEGREGREWREKGKGKQGKEEKKGMGREIRKGK